MFELLVGGNLHIFEILPVSNRIFQVVTFLVCAHGFMYIQFCIFN